MLPQEFYNVQRLVGSRKRPERYFESQEQSQNSNPIFSLNKERGSVKIIIRNGEIDFYP